MSYGREAYNSDIEKRAEGHMASCETGKRCYATKAFAKEHLVSLLQRGEPKVGSLNAYRCSKCGFFHVGHKKPWLRKQK